MNLLNFSFFQLISELSSNQQWLPHYSSKLTTFAIGISYWNRGIQDKLQWRYSTLYTLC